MLENEIQSLEALINAKASSSEMLAWKRVKAAIPQWTSVKDKLPPPGKVVIGYTPRYKPDMADCCGDSLQYNCQQMVTKKKTRWWDPGITHWTLPPPAPK
jgi:hypothetical protein